MNETPWVVILAGGVGSRFWPLSTPERPKQLLPLVTDKPLLVDQLERLAPLVPLERTLVLTRESLVNAILEAAPLLTRSHILAEPKQIGTAGALAYAAAEIKKRGGADAVMICVHADWAVGNPEEFRATLRRAVDVAVTNNSLVTVGIVPTRPEIGFGYIAPGDDVVTHSFAKRVSKFVEKPNAEKATEFISKGFLWNSGIFVWRVSDFLSEVQKLTPEVAPALNDMETFFEMVKPISVDEGVLERSSRVMVIPGDFGWDDIGTWEALDRLRPGRAAELKATLTSTS